MRSRSGASGAAVVGQSIRSRKRSINGWRMGRSLRAQESRQDISLSGTGVIEPFMASSTTVQVSSNRAFGGLLSYRFMLTPTSAVEANYQMTYENNIHFYANPNNYNILTRTQEISGEYVHSFVFKNFNRFLRAGPGAFIFLPIRNSGTKSRLTPNSKLRLALSMVPDLPTQISPSSTFVLNIAAGSLKVPNLRRYPMGYQPLVQHQQSGSRRGLSLLEAGNREQGSGNSQKGWALAHPFWFAWNEEIAEFLGN